MRRYRTFHPLYLSFYSKPLYRDVGKNWRWVSFLYLLLLLSICWIPIMFKLQSGVNKFVAEELPKFVKQVPVITIDAGEVSIDAEVPYSITDPDTDEVLVVIDTGGTFNSLEEVDAYALLTRTHLHMQKSPSETRTFDVAQMEHLVIDRQTVYEWADAVKGWLAPVMFPFAVISSYIYRVLQILLYAAIGILISRSMALTLDFQSLISLAIVADTPAIILNTVHNYADLGIPMWWAVSFILSMGYLYFGIKACSEDGPVIEI
ncbi:MAG: DUF1189 family protein [Nitrospirota bacterium]|nr:MAG: DUF1189 family protein [Nitrospirota bacterium]